MKKKFCGLKKCRIFALAKTQQGWCHSSVGRAKD